MKLIKCEPKVGITAHLINIFPQRVKYRSYVTQVMIPLFVQRYIWWLIAFVNNYPTKRLLRLFPPMIAIPSNSRQVYSWKTVDCGQTGSASDAHAVQWPSVVPIGSHFATITTWMAFDNRTQRFVKRFLLWKT